MVTQVPACVACYPHQRFCLEHRSVRFGEPRRGNNELAQ